MRKPWKIPALCCWMLCCYLTADAQDNHYGWMQFGSRNSVLYGAGLSRFEDQSAVIQNPATLSEAKGSSFNFNTNAVGFNYINFENGLGQGFNLTNSNFNVLPSMASGVLKPKKHKRDWVLGYALYHSNTDRLNFTDRTEQKEDLIDNSEMPGPENYLSQYQLTTDLDEVSAVAGVGWSISDKVSLGLSQTFVYRGFEMVDNFSANVIPDLNSGATVDLVSVDYDTYMRYWKIMTYTKLGMTAQAGKWNFGITITTPALGLMGGGETNADLRLTNVRLPADPTGPRRSFLANGRYEKMKVKYKMPLSIALGATRRFGNVRMFGSLHFYGSVEKYSILNPGEAPFIQPATSENILYTPDFLALWDGKRNLFNGAIAADWIIRDDYHMLFSFRNDNYFSSVNRQEDGFTSSKKTWNNYHLTFGTQRNFKSSEWVIGLRLNMGGRNDFPQPFSFYDPAEDNLFQGDRQTGKIRSSGLQLLLSYTFKIGDNQ